MKQNDVNTEVPVAHLSERYLKEYRSSLMTSVALSTFSAVANLTGVAVMVAIGIEVASHPWFWIMPLLGGVITVNGFYNHLADVYINILRLEDNKTVSEKKEVNLETVIGVARDKARGKARNTDIDKEGGKDKENYRVSLDISRLELAMSSLVEVLYKKSKLQNSDSKAAEFEKSADYFMRVIAKRYCPDILPGKKKEDAFYIDFAPYDNQYFASEREAFVSTMLSNVSNLSFNLLLIAGLSYVGYGALTLASISMVDTILVVFCAVQAVKISYNVYDACSNIYKARADRSFYNKLASNVSMTSDEVSYEDLKDQSLLNKILDREVKELKVSGEEEKNLRKEVIGKFTAMLEEKGEERKKKAEELEASKKSGESAETKTVDIGSHMQAIKKERDDGLEKVYQLSAA